MFPCSPVPNALRFSLNSIAFWMGASPATISKAGMGLVGRWRTIPNYIRVESLIACDPKTQITVRTSHLFVKEKQELTCSAHKSSYVWPNKNHEQRQGVLEFGDGLVWHSIWRKAAAAYVFPMQKHRVSFLATVRLRFRSFCVCISVAIYGIHIRKGHNTLHYGLSQNVSTFMWNAYDWTMCLPIAQ